MTPETQPCELCYMNPPWEATEDGELTFLPVPEALPGDALCADCRRQADEWARAEKVHREENHQAPYEHNCMMCSMEAYAEDQERTWQEHIARCEECRTSPHDFNTYEVPPSPRCRACGAEADKAAPDAVCTSSRVREGHRDLC